jgi:membrane-associated progesterone receptor component
MLAKIEVATDPELSKAYPNQRAAHVEIELNDGRLFKHFQPTRKGDPEMPLTDDELNEKYIELAAPVLGDADARKLLEAARGDIPTMQTAGDLTDAAKPIYLAIQGTIYDVSSGRQFYGPDGVYPFAGRECARAFALVSTDTADCVADISGLGPMEMESLRDWRAKFDFKYPVVGSVRE